MGRRQDRRERAEHNFQHDFPQKLPKSSDQRDNSFSAVLLLLLLSRGGMPGLRHSGGPQPYDKKRQYGKSKTHGFGRFRRRFLVEFGQHQSGVFALRKPFPRLKISRLRSSKSQ